MSQLCKTNPISAAPKPTQPLIPLGVTPISRPSRFKKTNPNKPNPATPGKHRESSIQHQVSSPVYAKQTQFPKGQNQRNLLCHTDLPQYSTPPNPKKQSQNKPNPSQKLELCSTLSKVEGPNKPILPPDSPMSFYNTTISASSAVKNTPRIIHPLPIAPESSIIRALKNPNLQRKHIWPTTSHNKSNCSSAAR